MALPNGRDNATANFQFLIASNELATTKILLCPNDTQRIPATNWTTCAMTNVSYCLGNDADDKEPRNILVTDRNLSGFEFTGLNDNTACYVLSVPGGGSGAKWRRVSCHGVNVGNLTLSDGSVQEFDDRRLLSTILNFDPAKDTVDGTLRFFIHRLRDGTCGFKPATDRAHSAHRRQMNGKARKRGFVRQPAQRWRESWRAWPTRIVGLPETVVEGAITTC